ncbi:MAG: cyclophilin-like family protein [Promethearchaeota archaeon]
MDYIILENEQIGKIKIYLNKNDCPETCKKIWDSLPLELSLSRWGDELYGPIPVKIEPERPKEECEIGDVAYWLEGSGFCILFGKTPVSRGSKPRLISPGNVFGKIDGDVSVFKKFQNLRCRLLKGE